MDLDYPAQEKRHSPDLTDAKDATIPGYQELLALLQPQLMYQTYSHVSDNIEAKKRTGKAFA
jgi:hypothetical protein